MKRIYSEPADIKVYARGKGVVVNEKSLLAFDNQTKQIVAVGNEVLQVEAQQEMQYTIVSPFHQGRILDFTCAHKIIKFLLYKAGMKNRLVKPELIICVPPNPSEVDSKAYEEVLLLCGAKKVQISTELFDHVIQTIENQPGTKNVKYIIGITKEEPVAYIKEALSEVIESANRQGFTKEWIAELLKGDQV